MEILTLEQKKSKDSLEEFLNSLREILQKTRCPNCGSLNTIKQFTSDKIHCVCTECSHSWLIEEIVKRGEIKCK